MARRVRTGGLSAEKSEMPGFIKPQLATLKARAPKGDQWLHEIKFDCSGAYSAKLLNGTRHRFSGFSQPRQCGEDVFRMLVTGAPANFGGGGMPQRIIVSSRSPALRTTGAG
jgi:hypothetical protein